MNMTNFSKNEFVDFAWNSTEGAGCKVWRVLSSGKYIEDFARWHGMNSSPPYTFDSDESMPYEMSVVNAFDKNGLKKILEELKDDIDLQIERLQRKRNNLDDSLNRLEQEQAD